ncbi:carboxypeptidase-like regulatory domain-containing protein [Singulisphaera sp. PoT]|uniref:carboxypeptidase-like regulatory domain-containing protein n=1 Tax=Singulisphaera sp. PoT TaxID=3411797 RepID=UPI003BF6072B
MKSYRAAAALGLLTLIGCGGGGGEEDYYTLVPVSGKVTLDGKPLEGATITFNASDGNKPMTDGSDLTGSDGSFSAKFRNRSGLSPGKYKVTVNRPKSDLPGKTRPPELDPFMASMAIDAGNKKKSARKVEQPWLYGDPSHTPLSHEVSARGDSDLQFDLKSSAK